MAHVLIMLELPRLERMGTERFGLCGADEGRSREGAAALLWVRRGPERTSPQERGTHRDSAEKQSGN